MYNKFKSCKKPSGNQQLPRALDPPSPSDPCTSPFSCLTHRPRPQADNDYTLAGNLCALSPYYLLLFMPFPLFTSFSFFAPRARSRCSCFVAVVAHTPFCGMQKWTRRPLLALPPQSTKHTHKQTSNSQWALFDNSCHFE